MAKEKKSESKGKEEKEKEEKEKEEIEEKCVDRNCPFHGSLSVRGRTFKGYVKKIVEKRAVIEFERLFYHPKYERYSKRKSKLHAHIPQCLMPKVKIGSYVKIGECRPLSKIIHFVMLEIIK